MKCPSCAVIFPDHIGTCPRCKVKLVGDEAPLDPKLREEFKVKVQKARELAKQKGSTKKRETRAPKKQARPTPAAEEIKAAAPKAKEAIKKPKTAPPKKAGRPAREVAEALPERPRAPVRPAPPPPGIMAQRPAKSRSGLLIAAALLTVVIIAAWFIMTRESRAYRSAGKADTVEAYQAFAGRFPDGEHAGQARLQIAKLKLSEIQNEPEPAKYESFLDEFGDTPLAEEARREWEQILITTARDRDDVALFRKYTEAFAGGIHFDEAQLRADELTRIDAFLDNPEYATWRFDTSEVGENLTLWATRNLHPGDTLHALERGGEQLGECSLGNITVGSSSYRDIRKAMDQIDFYAIRCPAFQNAYPSKRKLGVNFTAFSTWIGQTDEQALKQMIVEQIRKAAPKQTFEIVYPAGGDAENYWGTVNVSYGDLRYTRAIDVPPGLGGRGYRSKVGLRVDLRTTENVGHTWTRLRVTVNSPRRFPPGETGSSADGVLRDTALRLLGTKLPRLAPR